MLGNVLNQLVGVICAEAYNAITRSDVSLINSGRLMATYVEIMIETRNRRVTYRLGEKDEQGVYKGSQSEIDFRRDYQRNPIR